MAQKVVLKVLNMTDEKTKLKAMRAAVISGVDSVAADLKYQKLTVRGSMDALALANELKKVGKVEIISVGPAKEEKKRTEERGKKEEKKDEKKDQKK